MKWLEIIELRLVGENRDNTEQKLENLIEEFRKEVEKDSIKILSRVAIETDFHIHLIHNSDEISIDGSPLGLQLVSTLKEFGLVNHSVWIEKQIK